MCFGSALCKVDVRLKYIFNSNTIYVALLPIVFTERPRLAVGAIGLKFLFLQISF